MKEVKISPASNLEIHIHMTGQMEEDLKKCMKLAAQIGDGPDCNECSWRDLVIDNGSGGVAMCTLPVVRDEVARLAEEYGKAGRQL